MNAIVPALMALPYVVRAVLTGVGSRRRNDSWPVSVASGVFFPVAWTAWYVRDVLLPPVRPRRRTARRAA